MRDTSKISALIPAFRRGGKSFLIKFGEAIPELQELLEQHAVMDEWIRYADHKLDCAVEHWRKTWPHAPERSIPECTCGLNNLRELSTIERCIKAVGNAIKKR